MVFISNYQEVSTIKADRSNKFSKFMRNKFWEICKIFGHLLNFLFWLLFRLLSCTIKKSFSFHDLKWPVGNFDLKLRKSVYIGLRTKNFLYFMNYFTEKYKKTQLLGTHFKISIENNISKDVRPLFNRVIIEKFDQICSFYGYMQ
jgi:hypothetical protein